MSIRVSKKSILIVCATQSELEPLLKRFGKPVNFPGNILSYKYNGTNIDVLVSGVGILNTSYRLTKALAKKNYSLVINAGIAGSFNEKIKIGSVVNVIKERVGDLGAEDDANFSDAFTLNLIDKKEFPYIKGLLIASKMETSSELKKLKKVSGITVNKVHGSESSIKKIYSLYKPDIESMEGAAVFYCCLMEKIPVMQLRGISNKVEKRNRANWNIPLAISNLNEKTGEILDEITLSLNP